MFVYVCLFVVIASKESRVRTRKKLNCEEKCLNSHIFFPSFPSPSSVGGRKASFQHGEWRRRFGVVHSYHCLRCHFGQTTSRFLARSWKCKPHTGRTRCASTSKRRRTWILEEITRSEKLVRGLVNSDWLILEEKWRCGLQNSFTCMVDSCMLFFARQEAMIDCPEWQIHTIKLDINVLLSCKQLQ